ncbi:hypothetical protein ASE66_23055 [Bosea sp. Root483D1]|nr:hypothetical protein ASE66_23055 [Bosea sp. Root483D1]
MVPPATVSIVVVPEVFAFTSIPMPPARFITAFMPVTLMASLVGPDWLTTSPPLPLKLLGVVVVAKVTLIAVPKIVSSDGKVALRSAPVFPMFTLAAGAPTIIVPPLSSVH